MRGFRVAWMAMCLSSCLLAGWPGDPTVGDTGGGDTALVETDTDTEPADPCLTAIGVDCATFEQAYLKASNTGVNDNFGTSVALDGDTLAVGAYNEGSAATGVNGDQADNSASGAGAVYVFVRSGSTWTQQAYVKASNTESYDRFGISVALDGDTLAVGAYGESSADIDLDGDQADNSASQAGAVYVRIIAP